jgi:hypothetical protein
MLCLQRIHLRQGIRAAAERFRTRALTAVMNYLSSAFTFPDLRFPYRIRGFRSCFADERRLRARGCYVVQISASSNILNTTVGFSRQAILWIFGATDVQL